MEGPPASCSAAAAPLSIAYMQGCIELLEAMALPAVERLSDDEPAPKASPKKKEKEQKKPKASPKKKGRSELKKRPATASGTSSKEDGPRKKPAREEVLHEELKIYKCLYKATNTYGLKIGKKQVMTVRDSLLLEHACFASLRSDRSRVWTRTSGPRSLRLVLRELFNVFV